MKVLAKIERPNAFNFLKKNHHEFVVFFCVFFYKLLNSSYTVGRL